MLGEKAATALDLPDAVFDQLILFGTHDYPANFLDLDHQPSILKKGYYSPRKSEGIEVDALATAGTTRGLNGADNPCSA